LLYKGSWFDIQYPSNFSPKPVSPINTFNNANNIITDEATFISPDKSVEFFVYSPQWSGNPKNYLEKTSDEILISENISKNPQEFASQYGDTIIKTVIFRASDKSYFRSYTSIMQQVGTQSPLHHVFGIKYKNDVSYKRYKNAFEQFKKSLHQYAD